MPRILHFSDLHLGVENYGRLDVETGLSTRLMDFLRALDFVVNYALEQAVDLVLFTGDAFKNRDPTPTHQREFARRIRRLREAGIPVFLLVGNHDLPAAVNRAHSMEIYDTLGLEQIHVAHRPGRYDVPTNGGLVRIFAVPWATRSRLLARDDVHRLSNEELVARLQDAVATLIQNFAREAEEGETPAVLAAHLTVEGAAPGAERNVLLGHDIVVPRSVVAQPGFDYVALGHIHKHQALHETPPVVYAGSIERIDFGEAKEPKGFVVADVKRGGTTWKFVETPARPLVHIELDVRGADDPLAAVRAEVERHQVEGAIVKLTVRCTLEQVGHLRDPDLRKLLEEAEYIAAIQRRVDRPHRLRLGDLGSVAGLSPRELLRRYLEQKQVEPARAEVLLRYADEIWSERAEAET